MAALLLTAGPGLAGSGDWNGDQIEWLAYDDGLRTAKEKGRPICLIFYTSWCPHCTNYSKVFNDSRIVEKAKEFVMIRIDKDQNRELSRQYSPDGEYIPRTYFLSSKGELDASLTENRPKYKYFYNENDPGSLLAGMERAVAKLQAR
jgi:glutaredoxin